MMPKLENFIHEWKVDVRHKTAQHKSGLIFRHVAHGADGNEKIEVSNMGEWIKNCRLVGEDASQRQVMAERLFNEFVQIYQYVISKIPYKENGGR